MASRPDARVGLMDGPAELPRKNGELVFSAPWEGRAFGMAVLLSDASHYGWDEFRAQLVARIDEGPGGYYEHWLGALESVLLRRGIVTTEELAARTEQLADAAGDDHDHDHDHDDDDHHHHHHAVG